MSLTVWQATYDLLRALDLTTIFGNPGSTEQPFLKNFPSDFQYILGLQEATVVAMADGFSQSSRKAVLVSLHTAAGTGNGMCNIMTAFLNKTPLIIMAGQQTREMLIGDPFLANIDETMMPRPWVKWAYQPVRAQDVPAAIMRAYAIALQPPAGPVFLSVPLDDWDKIALGPAIVRSVSTRFGPDPERLKLFADRIRLSKNPVLIYGQEIDRSGAWEVGIKLAEKLRVPVFTAPLAERVPFPQTHPQNQGVLPTAMGPLSKRLQGFDLVIVIGASVFRYYPYIAGPVIPKGTELIQITSDPSDASAAIVGDSLLSDAKLAIEGLLDLLPTFPNRVLPAPLIHNKQLPSSPNDPLSAVEVFAALSELRPHDAIIVQESPSNYGEFSLWWPVSTPDSYYKFSSGGLGWGGPAAVGITLAQKMSGANRPVILPIGDGSFQYSVQSLYTAVQHKLNVVCIVLCNTEYAILKDFAVLEKTPNVPALDIPGLDIVSTAKGFGCPGYLAKTCEEIKQAFAMALKATGPTVIEIPIKQQSRALVPVNNKEETVQ